MRNKNLTSLLISLLVLIFTSSVTAQSWVEKAKSVPSTQGNYQQYGISVSASGLYAVVGAMGYNNQTGCAYVLYYNGSSWVTQGKLTASDGAAGEYFGCSVGISGDDIVVGAYVNDDKGAAYVFTKPISGWSDMTETAKLTASDGANYDGFGVSVAIYQNSIVVGADSDDDNGPSSGSAYVFTKQSASWISTTQTAKLTTTNGADHDYFGNAVSIYGDDIVIGAYENDDNGTASGTVYVFSKPASGWMNVTTENAQLSASDGGNGHHFGHSVCIYDDNIVIGTWEDNGSGNGSAYVFTKPITGWTSTTETAILNASDGAANDYFGTSVSISENTVVVGANYDDDNGFESGSAYIFTKPVSGWTNTTENSKITASDLTSDDYFGVSVSISGNIIVVGADGGDDNGMNSGAAYLFVSSPTSINAPLETAITIYPNPFSENLFIDSETYTRNTHYEIYNGLYQVVMSGSFRNNTLLQTKELPQGVYILKIISGHHFFIEKLVKE